MAAATRLSSVDGEAGELLIAGFPVEELAPRAIVRGATWLLWHGSLPTADELDAFRAPPGRPAGAAGGYAGPAAGRGPATGARHGCPAHGGRHPQPGRGRRRPAGGRRILVAAFPTIVAAYWRLLRGEEPLAPREDLGHAASFLYMLSGEEPSPERARGLETYLNTVSDHGLNASTFTARVIVSTRSDLISAVTGAVGALKGPLHGGAPGPALDMVFEIGTPERAEAVLREKLARGERLMGFGHRVYRVRDPRADVLAAAAERFYQPRRRRGALRPRPRGRGHGPAPAARGQAGPPAGYQRGVLHRPAAPRPRPADGAVHPHLRHRPRGGLDRHALEQLATGRLIRPQSEYVGERGRRWVAVEERAAVVVA